MADEDAPPLTRTPSAPPDDGGAEDLFEFVDIPPDAEDDSAKQAYLAECDDAAAIIKDEKTIEESPLLPAAQEKPSTPAEQTKQKSIFESSGIGPHLDELRRRLIISAVLFIPAFAVGLYLYVPLWDLLLIPLADASPHLLRFQALGPSDGLILSMKMAFAFALIVSSPVWIGQVWSFIAPGLSGRERRWLYLSLGAGVVLFLVGVLVAYWQAIPLALGFLLTLNQSLTGWENSFTGSGYVNFVVTCMVAFGIAFETPLVMMFLGWIGLLTPQGIKEWWRVVVLGVFVLAAVLTPPDPFTQLLLAIPMLCLFFLGYFLVRWTCKNEK